MVEGFPSFFQLWALKRIDEDFDMSRWIRWKERRYLAGREAGDPVEKPILEITYDEIGTYKDRFVLSDRVWLCLYDIWTRAGDDGFDRLCRELFSLDTIDYETFEALVEKYIPGYGHRLDKWLNTTVYDESMALKK